MTVVEEHTSPDQVLRLLVTRSDDGDMSVGFEHCSWHTHGDVLAALTGLPEAEAIRRLVSEIVMDRQVLAVAKIDGKVMDVWPADDPNAEIEWQTEDETIEFRRWSG